MPAQFKETIAPLREKTDIHVQWSVKRQPERYPLKIAFKKAFKKKLPRNSLPGQLTQIMGLLS